MKKTISILLFTIIITVCSAQSQEYSFSEKYDVEVPAKLTVSSYIGTIDIISSDVNEIELMYLITKNNRIISYNKDDIQNEGISLKVQQDKNNLDISVKYPGDYFELDFSNRIYINFEIHLPKETDCDLITHDGNISIKGLKSDQKCTTADGNITISDVNGKTTIKASDGNITLSKINGSVSVNASDAIIHAEEIKGSVYIDGSDENMFLNNINGQVHCISSEGNIELKNVNGEVTAQTSEGNIIFTNLSGSIEAYTMAGDVQGNIQELKKPITIEAGRGDIDISINKRLGLDLNIRGIRNNTPLKNFRGSSNKYFMKGKVNGGGMAVNLLSIDGKINIAYE